MAARNGKLHLTSLKPIFPVKSKVNMKEAALPGPTGQAMPHHEQRPCKDTFHPTKHEEACFLQALYPEKAQPRLPSLSPEAGPISDESLLRCQLVVLLFLEENKVTRMGVSYTGHGITERHPS